MIGLIKYKNSCSYVYLWRVLTVISFSTFVTFIRNELDSFFNVFFFNNTLWDYANAIKHEPHYLNNSNICKVILVFIGKTHFSICSQMGREELSRPRQRSLPRHRRAPRRKTDRRTLFIYLPGDNAEITWEEEGKERCRERPVAERARSRRELNCVVLRSSRNRWRTPDRTEARSFGPSGKVSDDAPFWIRHCLICAKVEPANHPEHNPENQSDSKRLHTVHDYFCMFI